MAVSALNAERDNILQIEKLREFFLVLNAMLRNLLLWSSKSRSYDVSEIAEIRSAMKIIMLQIKTHFYSKKIVTLGNEDLLSESGFTFKAYFLSVSVAI